MKRYGFHQAEGFVDRLIDREVNSLAELDALAVRASNILTPKASGYYKCDLSVDGVVRDRFDLMPSKGSGVDDLGRKPSDVLRAHGLA